MNNLVVEIWQVDNNGAYLHSGTDNANRRDRNFQGFGRFTTNERGEYRFRTVKPVPYPGRCPHGNLIPGLAELGLPAEALERVRAATNEAGEAMTKAVSPDTSRVVIRRIGEQIQSDLVLMLKLKRVGIQPGREVILMAGDDGVRVTAGDSADAVTTELPSHIAAHIFVSVNSRYQPVAGA